MIFAVFWKNLGLNLGFYLFKDVIIMYRQIKGKDVWHFCTNCSMWPTSDYKESESPTPGELCNECKSKKKSGECR